MNEPTRERITATLANTTPTENRQPPAERTDPHGMRWTRRSVTWDGIGLYAPATVSDCPRRLLTRATELDEMDAAAGAVAA